MKRSLIAALVGFVTALAIQTPTAAAQAASTATATQPLALSAFGAASGTFTNLLGGRNLGITAGADLAFLTYRRYRPVLELRGTYPINSGQVDGQKNFMGGLRVERDFGRLHPYVDFLAGRGEIKYQHGGLQIASLVFLTSTSTVLSPGLGADYDVTPHWSVRADFQYQHWDVPFPTSGGYPTGVLDGSSGVINPKVLNLGAVYRFDFNHHYHRPRHER